MVTTMKYTKVTRPDKCPRPGCGGVLAKDGDDPDALTCMICSTSLDLRPLRREGRSYLLEDKQRAVAMANRIGVQQTAKILGLPPHAIYSFQRGDGVQQIQRIQPLKEPPTGDKIATPNPPAVRVRVKPPDQGAVPETYKVCLELELTLVIKPKISISED